jgi:predicted RNase H-like HicB family nuclease
VGSDRKGKTVTEKTPEEILAAIDRALEETAAGLGAAKAKPRHSPVDSGQPVSPRKPKTPEEILAAIDKALEETRRRLAEADIDGTPGTAGV